MATVNSDLDYFDGFSEHPVYLDYNVLDEQKTAEVVLFEKEGGLQYDWHIDCEQLTNAQLKCNHHLHKALFAESFTSGVNMLGEKMSQDDIKYWRSKAKRSRTYAKKWRKKAQDIVRQEGLQKRTLNA